MVTNSNRSTKVGTLSLFRSVLTKLNRSGNCKSRAAEPETEQRRLLSQKRSRALQRNGWEPRSSRAEARRCARNSSAGGRWSDRERTSMCGGAHAVPGARGAHAIFFRCKGPSNILSTGRGPSNILSTGSPYRLHEQELLFAR